MIANLAAALIALHGQTVAQAHGMVPTWEGLIVPGGAVGGGRHLRTFKGFGARPDSIWLRGVRDSLGQEAIPNWIGTLHDDPTAEPFFPLQWAVQNTGQDYNGDVGTAGADVGAVKAWETTTGDSSIIVAFLDGGIDITHPEFAGQLAYNMAEVNGVAGKDDDGNGFVDDTVGWDFVRGDGKVRDVGGHGTGTASIVVAKWNQMGLAGLAPKVRLLPIRVADGASRVTLQNLVDGMNYAVKRKAKIINVSLGGLPSPNLLDSAIVRAVRSGAVVVASAGNDSADLGVKPMYPAASRIPGMIVVGASDSRDNPSWYTNRSTKLVDLSAPGDALIAASIPEGDTLWTEGFEGSLAGWTTGGTGLAWGTEIVQGNTWLSDSPGKTYPRSSRRWARSPRLNAAGRSGLMLNLTMQGRVNGSDYFQIESSRDSTFANVDGALYLNGGFQQLNPVDIALDVGSDDGSPFYLRFTLVSDASSSSADSGVRIDNLVLRARDVPQPVGGAYARVWGTSFSAPMVTGSLALLASLHPKATPDSLIAALLRGVQVKSALSGYSRTGGRLWIPGAFAQMLGSTTIPSRPAIVGGLALRPGIFEVRETGAWRLDWHDIRGHLLGARSGSGPEAVPYSATGNVVWSLRADNRRTEGLVLAR